jgi:hypothetical protein
VIRQFRDEGRFFPELRKRHRDIRFSAAEDRLELRSLAESLVAGRIQSKHDFTKRDDSGHPAQIGQPFSPWKRFWKRGVAILKTQECEQNF